MRLEVKDISFQYSEDRTIFKDLTFSYETPGIMCILGSNGTGKSTLLKCLLNQNRIQKGSIRIDGKEAARYRPRELARKIAYLPQTHMPSFSFSVIDVVMMGRTAHVGYFASPGKEDRKIAEEKLNYLHIGHLAEKPYTALSGGERQMVMIASAMAQEPEQMCIRDRKPIRTANRRRLRAIFRKKKPSLRKLPKRMETGRKKNRPTCTAAKSRKN